MFDDTGAVEFSDNTSLINTVNGSGILGLETPLSRMPNGTNSVAYEGSFETIGYISSLSAPIAGATDGTMSIFVNFDGGTISGTTIGDITYFGASSLQTDTGATGTITGTIAGNGVSGTFSLTGANSTAAHSYEGNFYGWDAEDLCGGIIGSVTAAGSTSFTYGTFEAELD